MSWQYWSNGATWDEILDRRVRNLVIEVVEVVDWAHTVSDVNKFVLWAAYNLHWRPRVPARGTPASPLVVLVPLGFKRFSGILPMAVCKWLNCIK